MRSRQRDLRCGHVSLANSPPLEPQTRLPPQPSFRFVQRTTSSCGYGRRNHLACTLVAYSEELQTVGSDTSAGKAVLEDPTGRRAKWLRRAGRAVFLSFLAWLLAIVLGGLGLIPIATIPFTHLLRPTGPPVLVKPPAPRQPSAADLRPAVPAKAFVAKARQARRPVAGAHGHSASAPGHAGRTKTTPSSTVSHGRSSSAPGHNRTTTTRSKKP